MADTYEILQPDGTVREFTAAQFAESGRCHHVHPRLPQARPSGVAAVLRGRSTAQPTYR